MAVITLTTDFGLKDHYVSTLKGKLISALPAAILADISHLVPPFDIGQAAYILGHSFRNFPKDTIHIISVGSSSEKKLAHVALQLEDHFFIGCDNGIFSLLAPGISPTLIVDIAQGKETGSFAARDIYLPAAIRLAKGAQLQDLGPVREGVAQLIRPVSPPEENTLKGMVVYVDRFENLVTDITKDDFERNGKGRRFTIRLIGDEITEIHKAYGDVAEAGLVAFFNSDGVLEIAMNNGNASGLLNMKTGSVVRVVFE